MKRIKLSLIALSFCISGFGQTDTEIAHLQTFSKVYGYIKYFHPSDEASVLDWDKFAIYGAGEVVKCKNSEALMATLHDLFAPIAPAAGIFHSSDNIAYDFSTFTPENKEDYQLTFWQHHGLSAGMRNQEGPYQSIRVNRVQVGSDNTSGFGNLFTSIDAEAYRGKSIKFAGNVKLLPNSKGSGHLWLRVNLTDRQIGFFENMGENPITSSAWQQYEIIGNVDEKAESILLGCFLSGGGKLLVDHIQLSYEENGAWIEIPLGNSDFEQEAIAEKTETSPWLTRGEGYKFAIDEIDVYSGKRCATIEYAEKKDTALGQAIFEAQPQPGAWIKKSIGNSLSCIIPLSLYCNSDFTYPKAKPKSLADLQEAINQVNISPASLELRLGNTINTWNVFQHFFPYFDVVEVDWNAQLQTALKKCYSDQNYDDFLITLQELTAPLRDGHIFISGGTPKRYLPPIYWEWIENQLVVIQVFDENVDLKKGDIILAVDGVPARAYFDKIEKRISAGTKGWLNYRAQSMSLVGEQDSEIALATKEKTIRLKRNLSNIYPALERNNRPEHRWIEDDIIYLNISKIEMRVIDSLMPQLEKAKAIICDLRGYPNSNHEFISHLLSQADTTSAWMQVPQIIYPDHENIAGYSKHNWMLPAKEPHLDAKIIFITDGSAISYAESYMGYIEGYKLATIVGQPTAGTNGNVNPFQLPGNFGMRWTGMKVLKHDGSQHHVIGIIPDVLVEKTIKGLVEGRDEFLEKAIELAKD